MSNEKIKEETIAELVSKGKKYVYPEKVELWQKWVEARVNDRLDNGLSIETTIEIMEKLENGVPLDTVLEEYHNLSEQEKFADKNYALSWVANEMFNFGKGENGPEFHRRDFTYQYGPNAINEQLKADYENQFEENRQLDEKSRTEGDKKLEEPIKKTKEETIAELVSKGKKYIYPEKVELWQKWVEARVNDGLDNGLSIETTIEIMEKLENGVPLDTVLEEYHNLSEQEKFADKNYALSWVANEMFNFGKGENGPEFHRRDFTYQYGPNAINEQLKAGYENQFEENRQLDEKYSPLEKKISMRVVVENGITSGTTLEDVSKVTEKELQETITKEGEIYEEH